MIKVLRNLRERGVLISTKGSSHEEALTSMDGVVDRSKALSRSEFYALLTLTNELSTKYIGGWRLGTKLG